MNELLAKKLFSNYAPLKTNEFLKNYYNKINEIENIKNENIRASYCKEISRFFLNETVIKSAFIKKFSLNKSPNKTITIFELNAGNSRADICMINGHSVVFEIKTAYDSFARLKGQLSDYKKIFEYIYIIIPEKNIEIASKQISSEIGIIAYKQNINYTISFKTIKEPTYNNNISTKSQLLCLNKSELKKNFYDCFNNNQSIFIENILSNYKKEDIIKKYNVCIKNKYRNKWNFIYYHKNEIIPIDYQWFFKNNIEPSIVYK